MEHGKVKPFCSSLCANHIVGIQSVSETDKATSNDDIGFADLFP